MPQYSVKVKALGLTHTLNIWAEDSYKAQQRALNMAKRLLQTNKAEIKEPPERNPHSPLGAK